VTKNGQIKRVQLGCGLTTPPGWINVDGSWNARLAKYPLFRKVLRAVGILPADKFSVPWSSGILIHDVRKKLPFQDESIAAIYSSHMLEHLYFDQASRLLAECFRVLQPGGVLRIVVPDLRAIVEEYLAERPSEGRGGANLPTITPADRVNERLMLRSRTPHSGGILGAYAAFKDLHSHKWMYDSDSLIAHFNRAGFVEAQTMPFRTSHIPRVEEVEEASRVLNGTGICVEGIKPGSKGTAGK